MYAEAVDQDGSEQASEQTTAEDMVSHFLLLIVLLVLLFRLHFPDLHAANV